MATTIAITVAVFISLLDSVTSTVLFLNFKWTKHSWISATSNFEFCTSTLDLWLLSWMRFTLTVGAVLGLQKNIQDGLSRLKLFRRPIFILTFGIIVYVIVKFLCSTECARSKASTVWLWSFLGQSVLFSLGLSWSWWVLGKGTFRHPVLVINSDEEVGPVLERETQWSSDMDSESSNSSSDGSENRLVAVTCYFLIARTRPKTMTNWHSLQLIES